MTASTLLGGVTERFTLNVNLNAQGGGLSVQERVALPPDPVVTGWLASVADQVPPATLADAARLDP